MSWNSQEAYDKFHSTRSRTWYRLSLRRADLIARIGRWCPYRKYVPHCAKPIETEGEYNATIARLNLLLDSNPKDNTELEALGACIYAYEQKFPWPPNWDQE